MEYYLAIKTVHTPDNMDASQTHYDKWMNPGSTQYIQCGYRTWGWGGQDLAPTKEH